MAERCLRQLAARNAGHLRGRQGGRYASPFYSTAGIGAAGTKEDNSNFVPTFTKRGATVVVMEYDLCPKVTVTEIVWQTHTAIAWVFKNITRYGGNPSNLFVSGHSADGHLTAMALAHNWEKEGLPRDLIKGAVVTSGVYDLDVVAHLSVQQEIQMTPESARANDPLTQPPLVRCPVVVAVGGAEPRGWQQMSEDYFNYCKQQGMQADYLVIPGATHHTMSDQLLNLY